MPSRFAILTGGAVAARLRAVLVEGAMFGRTACVALALILSAVPGSQPRAANWLGEEFLVVGPAATTRPAACRLSRRHRAQSWIISAPRNFAFWNSELRIVGFEDVHETAILPWAAQSIPRRYCSGTALIKRRPQIRDRLFDREDTLA